MTLKLYKPYERVYIKYLTYNNNRKKKFVINENIIDEFFKNRKDYDNIKISEFFINNPELVLKIIFVINKMVKKRNYISYISYKSKIKLLEDSLNLLNKRMNRFCAAPEEFRKVIPKKNTF